MENNIATVNKIDFLDEQSKILFECNKKYYETGDLKWRFLGLLRSHHIRFDEYIKINEIINDRIRSASNVYIFGAGNYGARVFEGMQLHDISDKLSGFIDNDTLKIGKVFCGKSVFKVEDIINQDNAIILLPECPYTLQMYLQLHEIGGVYDKNIIYVYNCYEEIVLEKELELETIFLNEKNRFIIFGKGRYNYSYDLKDLVNSCGGRILFEIKDNYYCDDTLGDLINERNNLFVICFSERDRRALINKGVNDNRIIQFFNTDGMLQYFDPLITDNYHRENEIFVDGGSLDCTASRNMMLWSGGKLKRIYAFEPGEESFRRCLGTLDYDRELAKITTVINCALWNDETKLNFEMTESLGSSRIRVDECNDKTIVVKTTTIDNITDDDEVTFIKLDIEGAEVEALEGARKAIIKNHPFMAISIYHKASDIIKIPSVIKELDSSYKFYIRCYHEDGIEMVLYCI